MALVYLWNDTIPFNSIEMKCNVQRVLHNTDI